MPVQLHVLPMNYITNNFYFGTLAFYLYHMAQQKCTVNSCQNKLKFSFVFFFYRPQHSAWHIVEAQQIFAD